MIEALIIDALQRPLHSKSEFDQQRQVAPVVKHVLLVLYFEAI